jgi:hypothetical protein
METPIISPFLEDAVTAQEQPSSILDLASLVSRVYKGIKIGQARNAEAEQSPLYNNISKL